MIRRLQGLQHECDLLASEIVRLSTGELHEYDFASNGQRIDITDIWKAYLRALFEVRRSAIAKLRQRFRTAGFTTADRSEGEESPC